MHILLMHKLKYFIDINLPRHLHHVCALVYYLSISMSPSSQVTSLGTISVSRPGDGLPTTAMFDDIYKAVGSK